jgi:hypothetical protein
MKRYVCKIACTAFTTSIIEFSSQPRLRFNNIQLKDSSARISAPFLAFVSLVRGIDTRTTCELVAFSR